MKNKHNNNNNDNRNNEYKNRGNPNYSSLAVTPSLLSLNFFPSLTVQQLPIFLLPSPLRCLRLPPQAAASRSPPSTSSSLACSPPRKQQQGCVFLLPFCRKGLPPQQPRSGHVEPFTPSSLHSFLITPL